MDVANYRYNIVQPTASAEYISRGTIIRNSILFLYFLLVIYIGSCVNIKLLLSRQYFSSRLAIEKNRKNLINR